MKNKFGVAGIMLACFFLLSACGYRYGRGSAPWAGSTLTVPLIGGDDTGQLTQALIREISTSGSFCYVNCTGSYTLCVSLLNQHEEFIGYRYDTDKNGNLTNTTIPVETRAHALAEFSLVHNYSGRTVVGPERVSAWIDFDHEYHSGSDSLNLLSIGQVTDLESASIAVPPQLGEVLAKKIVDYISNAW